MLFDGSAVLPTATLWSRASEARHRVLVADLHGWLASRWRWIRPRTVPLLVAFIGMLGVLGATKYLSGYAYNDDLRLRVPVDLTNFGGDVATNNPTVPGLAAPQPSPGADSHAAGPLLLDSNRGHWRVLCGHSHRMPSAELGSAPGRTLGSPGELTPDRPAPRR